MWNRIVLIFKINTCRNPLPGMKQVLEKNKVVVAMSGGVDSSVAAALLKEGGFNAVGIFMKFWKDGNGKEPFSSTKSENRCCSVESETRARLVCEKLGIPFYVLNLEREFKKEVVDYFLRSIKLGITPNPCVVCNREIKFGLLIKKALSLGAQYIATGHYAQLSRENKKYKLYRGVDREKDQSYFLWQLSQKQLSHVLFPVGSFTKPEVRKLAKKFGLITAKTPESQEVCFVDNKIEDFLEKYIGKKSGAILNQNKKNIGKHNGIWFYTIGQRKGIKLSSGPYYVISKNKTKNQLIVSKNENDLFIKKFWSKQINLIGNNIESNFFCKVKIRYRSKMVSANVVIKGKRAEIIFKKAQRAITPGQSVVFYRGERLIGGGVIV